MKKETEVERETFFLSFSLFVFFYPFIHLDDDDDDARWWKGVGVDDRMNIRKWVGVVSVWNNDDDSARAPPGSGSWTKREKNFRTRNNLI